MLYEEKVRQIDSANQKIDEFDKDTLFLNIYYFWCLPIICRCTTFGVGLL